MRAAIDTQRAVYTAEPGSASGGEPFSGKRKNLLLAADGKPLLPPLAILVVGTGINTGVVTVGLMGSKDQLNYTVFGREVNLASRLETVSGRSRIIISEATLAEIIQDDASLALSSKSLEAVQVKGFRVRSPHLQSPMLMAERSWKPTKTPRKSITPATSPPRIRSKEVEPDLLRKLTSFTASLR